MRTQSNGVLTMQTKDRLIGASREVINDAKHWRERAEKMRALADAAANPHTKAMMRGVAADYDQLAERAEESGDSKSSFKLKPA
jgi:hypothetical protein